MMVVDGADVVGMMVVDGAGVVGMMLLMVLMWLE